MEKFKGISNKGRNRIKEHGELWRKGTDKGTGRSQQYISESTDYVIWVDFKNDIHYKIVN